MSRAPRMTAYGRIMAKKRLMAYQEENFKWEYLSGMRMRDLERKYRLNADEVRELVEELRLPVRQKGRKPGDMNHRQQAYDLARLETQRQIELARQETQARLAAPQAPQGGATLRQANRKDPDNG